MEVIFDKYQNIQKFITKYRKYKIDENFLDFDKFKLFMQNEEYILHNCIDVKKGRKVYIYIFDDNSKYIKITAQFKKLLYKLPEEPADIIIISRELLNIYLNKTFVKFPHLKIFNYLYKHFSQELPNAPLCSRHTVLTDEEVKILCSQELIIHPLCAPAISVNDPQNIWIGGEIGQIIKIESVSPLSGKVIRYRIVSPDSGKVLHIQKNKIEINEDDPVTIKDIGNKLEQPDEYDVDDDEPVGDD